MPAAVVPIRPGVIIAKGKRRSGFSPATERVARKFQRLLDVRPAAADAIESVLDGALLRAQAQGSLPPRWSA
jgi:hypothetical protein